MSRWFTFAIGGIFAIAFIVGSIATKTPAQASIGLFPAVSATHAPVSFRLTVSKGARTCLPNAHGIGTISSISDQAEKLHITVGGLPANSDFDVFIIQSPVAPFGLSWYQGDINTNSIGNGVVDFAGRFSVETFIVAPGSTAAPVVFHNAFPDASSNPATGPVHEYHVGIWFNSPETAAAVHCPTTVTPFNGTHNAGIQVLNTATFPLLNGPLRAFN
ncbi:MAG: hypothetical protein JO165_09620 [Candidatus Eremiobacteraeota bacterium]|nr:hypothetical protein [Candidatus Eremiobacteraeota bacterium]